MNHLTSCYNILSTSKFYEDFKDCKILYNSKGDLVSTFKEFQKNIVRLSKTIKSKQDRLNFLGDSWEFFSLFYMAYERNLICKNISNDIKTFKVNDIVIPDEDYGIDFYIQHNRTSVGIQCKFKSNLNELLDPKNSKLSNFILNARYKTDSDYYILITTSKLSYKIKELLSDYKNFYYIDISAIGNDNIGINFFDDFKTAITNNITTTRIIDNVKPNTLIDLPISNNDITTNDIFEIIDSLCIRLEKESNSILETSNEDIKTTISHFIMIKYFHHLGEILYDYDSNLSYIESDTFKRCFIIKYVYTNDEKLSSNNIGMSADILRMGDNFDNVSEYPAYLIYISNVSEMFESTHVNMSYSKVYSIINYNDFLDVDSLEKVVLKLT